MKRFLDAANFAAKKHCNQTRKGANAEPYINHPLEVAHLLLLHGGVTDEDVLSAAVLHDTLEDTTATREELVELFGERVALLVSEMTDDKSLSKDERKRLQVSHAPNLSDGAKLIKIGDKISNVEDIANNPPLGWEPERRMSYIAWAVEVVNATGAANEGLLGKFEQVKKDALEKLSKED